MKHNHIILPIVVVSLFFVSCDKSSDQQEGEEGFEPHPTWTDDSTNNFWDKQPSSDFTIDTAWDGDTTINF